MDIDEFLDNELRAGKESAKKNDTGAINGKETAAEANNTINSISPEDTITKADNIAITGNDSAKKEAADILSDIDSSIEKDDFNSAENLYLQSWNKLSEENFSWNDSLYSSLNAAGNKIRDRVGKLSLALEKKKNTIKGIIKKANREIENKNHEAALKIYSEITEMRNALPDFLLEEKKEINDSIFQLYAKLHDQIDSKFINDFKAQIETVDELARNSFSSLKSGNMENARNFYKKAVEIYKSLPHGFLPQKIALGDFLLGIYKDLSIYLEIEKLQKKLGNGTLPNNHKFASDEKLKYLYRELHGKVKETNELKNKL